MLTFAGQKSGKYIEITILIVIWLVVLLSPLMAQIDREIIYWREVVGHWIKLLPFLILSVFNHFILVPFLFFKKRKVWYFMAVLFTLVILSYTLYGLIPKQNHSFLNPEMKGEIRKGHPDSSPPPNDEQAGARRPAFPDRRPMPPPRNPVSLPPGVNTALLALLIIGFDTGLRTVFKWSESEQEKLRLEKENVNNQLAFLRHQVNPHFFMNTLNNIHALIDIDTEEAKEAIIRLSHLMRHLLYDSNRAGSPLAKEVQFIQSYIELMRLRYSDKVKISLQLPDTLPDKQIPPLLFTSLLENAFKHGISYRKASFIDMVLSVSENQLCFSIRNGKSGQEKYPDQSASGIGIENTRKRLDLLFASNYTLDIEDETDQYTVTLKIPL